MAPPMCQNNSYYPLLSHIACYISLELRFDMSEQPPSYEDVLANPSINSDALLLVRLEIWHYFKLRRSPILNHDLAQLFIALELAN